MPILPENAITKCVKCFDLTSPEAIAKDGGTITGSPTFSARGCDLDGSSDYVTYAIPNTLFSSSKISIVVEFTPDFAYDEDVQRYLCDATNGSRYVVTKRNNAGNNELRIILGSTTIADIASATYSTYWKQNERNVIVVSGTSGDTNVWLNGTQILTSDATAWSVTYPTQFWAGAAYTGAGYFDGEIHSISIHNDLLTGDDATALYNGDLFNFEQKADVYLDMMSQSSDGTNTITKDKSGNGNDFKLGDGTTTTTFPTFVNPGFETDGGDYMQSSNSGLLDTSLSAFTAFLVVDRAGIVGSDAFLSYEETDLSNIGCIFLNKATVWQFYAGGASADDAANFTYQKEQGLEVLIGTTTGTETCIWVNGQQGVDATDPEAIDLTANQKLTLFARGDTTTSRVLNGGKIYASGLIPFKLSPIQIRQLTQDLLTQYS